MRSLAQLETDYWTLRSMMADATSKEEFHDLIALRNEIDQERWDLFGDKEAWEAQYG